MTDSYRFIPGQSIIEDIDLDETLIHDQSGKRVTEADVEAEYQLLAAKRRTNLVPGGKSLNKDGSHSPQIHLVVSNATKDKIERAAAAQNMSVSRWLRETVEQRLAA